MCVQKAAVLEEVIEEVDDPKPVVEVENRSVVDDWSEPVRQLPEQTYYHAIGHSFPLVFNTRTYGRPSSVVSTAAQRYYGSLGK